MGLGVRKPGRRPRMKLSELRDFTGGLNLNAEQFRLEDNESPDLLNVDIDRRGGFQLRRGVLRTNASAIYTGFLSATGYTGLNGTDYIVCSQLTTCTHSTGGNFTAPGAFFPGTRIAPSRFAIMRGYLYATSGTLVDRTYRWDGTTWSPRTASATAAWQEDYATSGTHFPYALCAAVHGGYMWAAHTRENGTTYANRVRWSHPNEPERWRSLDYIDIDVGRDSDVITAIVPVSDHLLVFKNTGVYALYGYDPDTFTVVTVSNTVGTPSQESVVSTPFGVFFWNEADGLWAYDGKELQYAFEKMRECIRNETIPPAGLSKPHVGWVKDRVWVSVPWETADRSATLVLDPITRAWTRYDLALSAFCTALGGRAFAGIEGGTRLLELEIEGRTTDQFDSTSEHIDSYYRTRWVADGGTIVPKRWKRPEFVIHGGSTEELRVDVFLDWNPAEERRSFFLTGASTGTNATWDATNWDEAVWGFDGEYDVLVRGGTIGLARAVSLKINGPTTNTDWGVDSLTLKSVPKQVRS